MVGGEAPGVGSRFKQPGLAGTLQRLADEGLESFYRGPLARDLARDLTAAGTPLGMQDLNDQRALVVKPLQLSHTSGDVYNLPPPTQGLVSLLILGMLDRAGLSPTRADVLEQIHLTVEATKQAFKLRDQHVCDPADLKVDPQTLLTDAALTDLACKIDRNQAAPWGAKTHPGDTIWMGVIDSTGLAVSFIQSLYHEFGSGVVVGDSGVVWQNRGASFRLQSDHLLALRPQRKPFHTLNPAAARLSDGRTLVYGTMGGDGQPQTQAAIFTRYAVFGDNAQAAVTAPRWLLGRTWGSASDTLKLETRFEPSVVEQLSARGHVLESLGPFDESVGHAGMLARYPNGIVEAAADPRSDGAAAGY